LIRLIFFKKSIIVEIKMPSHHLQELIETRKLRLENQLRTLQHFQRLKESIELQKKLIEQCSFLLHTVQDKIK